MNEHEMTERISVLEDENRRLREALMPPMDIPTEWGLRPSGKRLFAALSSKARISKEAALFAIADGADITTKNLHVQMFHLRKAIQPYGYVIHNIWGSGYEMTRDEITCQDANVMTK